MTSPASPWPPPPPPPPPSGWYLASDGNWYRSSLPPAPGYELAADGRWYAPGDGPLDIAADLPDALVGPWRRSRWGLGDVGWGMLAYIVAGTVAAVLVAVVIAARDPSTTVADVEFGPFAIAILVLANAVAFVGVPWLASRNKGLRSLSRDFGLRIRPLDPLIGVGLGLAGMLAAGLVGAAIDALLGVEEATSNIPVDDLADGTEFVVFLAAVAIVTPIIEEVFFRGLVYRSFLKRGASTPAAIALTTLVFVLPHLPAVSGWQSVISLFGAIGVLGVTFNLACTWTDGRLAAPISAHMVVNGVAAIAVFVT